MPFKPGQSGNPGGRPKQLAAVQALARRHTVAAIKKLVHLMDTSENEYVQRACANDLLARGWGQPTAPINLGGDSSVTVIIQKGLGDEDAPDDEGAPGGQGSGG